MTMKVNCFFKPVMIFFILLLLPVVSVFGDTDKITEIHIATPAWEDQTNKDGTGLYFEMVRKVYEPYSIKMTYEIVPWKRAEKMINEEKADAMLCARKRKDRLTPKYPMVMEHTAVLFKKDNIKKWEGKRTLDGKTAIWIRGYDFHTDAKLKDLKLKWDEVDTHTQAWQLVEIGRYDIYIDALIDMDAYIRKNKIDMKPYQIEILWSEKAYMSFAKTAKSDKLIKIYDKRIIELFKSGELKKMHEKWNARFSPEAWKDDEN